YVFIRLDKPRPFEPLAGNAHGRTALAFGTPKAFHLNAPGRAAHPGNRTPSTGTPKALYHTLISYDTTPSALNLKPCRSPGCAARPRPLRYNAFGVRAGADALPPRLRL